MVAEDIVMRRADAKARAMLFASRPMDGSMDFYWSLILALPVPRVRHEREMLLATMTGGV